MTIQETVDQITREYQNQMSLLEAMPDEIAIRATSRGMIHIEEATYDENMDALHLIRRNIACKLSQYFASSGCLCLVYKTPDGDILMPCTDVENALERVSQGRCTLQPQTNQETTQEVVCAL